MELLEQNALEGTGGGECVAPASSVFTGRRRQDVPKAGHLDKAGESLPRETQHEHLYSPGWGG